MKFTISQSTLATHLAQVVGIVPIRPTYPVLANILIDASQHRISLTAFDLSVSITASFANAIEQEGRVTMPGRLMRDLVNSLPHKELRLHLQEGEQLEIGCIEAKYQLQGIKAEEFPQLPSLDENKGITLEAKSFLAALIPVVSSYAIDISKQVLTGVRFTLTEKSLELASTDAHRFALTRLSLSAQQTGGFTVPGVALDYFAKILKSSQEETVTIAWDEVQVKFSLGNTKLMSRLLEGTYPAYQQLIPDNFLLSVNFLANQMQTALTRLLILHGERKKSPLVKIENSSSRGQINLSLMDGSNGSGIEAIPAQVPEDITIAFNGEYLLEALKALPGKELQFHANHPNRPAILQAIETELACALILLMPCQMAKEIEQPVNTPPLPSKLQEEDESNQENGRSKEKAVTNS